MPRPLAALLVTALFASPSPAAPLPEGRPAESAYYPTAVGARWVYQTGGGEEVTWVVTAVEEKDGAKVVTVAIPWEDGKPFPIQKTSVSERGLFVTWLAGEECKPPLCLLRHPPTPGEKWETLSTIGLPVREQNEVFGPEAVEVPAGTFRAVRVVSDSRAAGDREWSRTTTWYAPGVGMVKKVMRRETLALKSFTPAGAAAAGETKPPVLRSPRKQMTLDGMVSSVAFGADGKSLASAGYGSPVKLWDVSTGKEMTPPGGLPGMALVVAFSADGQTLASTTKAGTIALSDVRTGKEGATLKGHAVRVAVLAFAPDGRTLASAGEDRTIKLWDVTTGNERATLKGPANGVCSLAFGPDGKSLASAGYGSPIKLWDVTTGQEQATLDGHRLAVLAVAYSPDGKTLASASEDQTIKLWDVRTGKERATLKGHTHWVWSVAFSPDGTTIATGSEAGTIKLWDAATGQERATLKGHTNRVCSVAFSPDGKTLASASLDHTVGLWEVIPSK